MLNVGTVQTIPRRGHGSTVWHPSLIVVDIGSTLGRFTGPSVAKVLTELCPWGHLNPAGVRAQVHSTLHVAPELTDEVIQRVCDALLIDRDAWPSPWPSSGFRAFPGTGAALAALAEVAPVVALSNMSVTGGERIAQVERYAGRHLRGIYTSFGLGGRKPERWLWHHIAGLHGTTTDQILHCGDRWIEDVLGAVHAGARAVWIPDGTSVSDHSPPPNFRDRVATVSNLSAIPHLTWPD